MASAAVTIEGTYSVPLITHVCLESHGLTVKIEDGKKVTAWASTQNVGGVAGDLAQELELTHGGRHRPTPITWAAASARSSTPTSGARPRPSSRRWPAAGR